MECNITSSSKITGINVTLVKDANKKVEKSYTNNKYIGVKNTTFHEHLDLPETLTEGEYECTITVTNTEGAVKSIKEKITFKEENSRS